MKKFSLIIIALMLFGSSFAQEDYVVEQRNNEFGFHLGATTGMGLSYRHWINKTGFQLTLLPIKSDNYTFISAGVTGLYTIRQSRLVRTFLYLGGHVIDREREGGYFIDDKDYTQYNIGFGPGFAFGKSVTFNVMAGYGLYDITGEFNMYPTGEIGLYFKF